MSQLLPQHFGKYVLTRKIAMGGMAEIFKAKVAGAEGFEKDLVIKRILPHFTEDDAFVKMFIDEASITAKLQHPNIVQIFDFDVVDAVYYIAMEYIEGKDLKDVLEECIHQKLSLSVAQCVWIIMEVSKGLHYAHTKEYKGKPLNIVHRDVSPSNAMVSYNGEVKLMDFGIAKAAQRSTKTMAGAVKGKVAYMSPEQARGKALDGRSDLFALGIMAWEMLTGRRLFLAESDFETLTNVLKADAPPPSSLNPDVPPDLDPIILRALHKKREDRWPNTEAFGRELTRWYYSNVIDLEKEKLKPLMHRLFKDDIDDLERMTDEERLVGSGGGAPSANAEATNIMTSPGQGAPQSEEATRLDGTALGGGGGAVGPVGPPASEERTRAMPAAAGGAHTATQQASFQMMPPPQRHRRSKVPLILLLLLLVLGGGGAGLYFGVIADSGEPVKPPPPEAPTTGRLVLQVTPKEAKAKLKVNGTPVDFEATGLELGKLVQIEAEAEGYEPYEKFYKMEDEEELFAIELTKAAAKVMLSIKIADSEASVFVNRRRIGTGTVTYDGKAGDEVLIRVVPSTGDPIEQTLTLAVDTPVIEIQTGAELAVTVDPPDATVTTDLGAPSSREEGLWVVAGLEVGAEVNVVVDAPDHIASKQAVTMASAKETLNVKLRRKPAGRGNIRVVARPWGEVFYKGRSHGTTPMTLKNVPLGTHSVKVKGPRGASKTLTVTLSKANETQKAEANFR